MITTLKIKIIFFERCINPAKTIMLMPNCQMVAKPIDLNWISNFQPKFTITISTKTNHSPRLTKNADNSEGDFLLPTIKAERPARKLKAGAQKFVINRVKKIGKVDCEGSDGSKKNAG